MRLMSCSDFQIREFAPDALPQYGILSHTWAQNGEEVTFDDVLTGSGKTKAGYKKIKFCARRAVQDGLEFFWIDTCCINKSSSAELQESINSAFRWCRNAARCYVYLSDVSAEATEAGELPASWEQSFKVSRWFTRAWTLQELIAPKSVEFFSAEGELLGDKRSLEQLIHDITGIPVPALRGEPLAKYSISERLSWVQRRRALREEDRVYSLLGLFGLSMPIMYGEGFSHAFQRLQAEIRRHIKNTTTASRTGIRLLVTRSEPLRMETVPIHNGLQYAILSHTWGEDEVTFEDMRAATAEQKSSYSKLTRCCTLAAKHGFEYLWVDTCCIDKSSSSELQEAICSMYMWYKSARICYVYLDDCKHEDMMSFAGCKWFTRGWTLQELVAPDFVEFYDQNWVEIGTKQSLCTHIAEITSIDPLILRGADPTHRTIAERMSWAASRRTTRIEDTAYSLMGLFNVFMPMLYGEGTRAFIRLQEEIIKQTEDYTIFSWKAKTSFPSQRGIFAHSPAEFMASGPDRVTPRIAHPCNQPDQHLPPALTSRGLLLTLPLAPCDSMENTYLGWVSCRTSKEMEGDEKTDMLCVRLKETQSSPQIFARISADELESRPLVDSRDFKQQTICVLPSNIDAMAAMNVPKRGTIIINLSIDAKVFDTPIPLGIASEASWEENPKSLLFSYDRENGPLAVIAFGLEIEFMVFIGLQDKIPWCSIMNHNDAREQGSSFDDLKSLDAISETLTDYSDRAKTSLSNCRVATAALRAAHCTDLDLSAFYLHVEVLDVS